MIIINIFRSIVSRCNKIQFNDVVFEYTVSCSMNFWLQFRCIVIEKIVPLFHITLFFFLQLACQRWHLIRHSINFPGIGHWPFTTMTSEGGLTAIWSIRSFAVEALTLDRVEWEQAYCYNSSNENEL